MDRELSRWSRADGTRLSSLTETRVIEIAHARPAELDLDIPEADELFRTRRARLVQASPATTEPSRSPAASCVARDDAAATGMCLFTGPYRDRDRGELVGARGGVRDRSEGT